MPAGVTDNGFREHFTIDGTTFSSFPAQFEPTRTIKQAFFPTASGRSTVSSLYRRAGDPNQLDEFVFPVELESLGSTDKTVLEKLRRDGLPHTLAIWKPEIWTYTASQGQQMFYLPRKNAATVLGRATSGSAGYPLTFTVNDVSKTVAYQATVTSASAVPADTAWVENDGFDLKYGTALTVGDVVRITYYPLFRVMVDEDRSRIVSTRRQIETIVFREIND